MTIAPPIEWLDALAEKNGAGAPMPLHELVRNSLDRVIATRFDDGQRFWSEAELSSRLKVSRVTVRRALDDLSRQGALTRHRAKGTFVRKSGTAIDATPTASAPVSFRSVGIFVMQYSSPFLADFLEAFSIAAAQCDLELSVYRTHEGDTGERAIEQISAPPSDEAIILFANDPALTVDLYSHLQQIGYRVVTVDVMIPDYPAAYVGTNNDMGIRLALRHLFELGHQRIGFLLSEPEELVVPQARLNTFYSVARERQLSEMRSYCAGVRMGQDPVAAAYHLMDEIWADPAGRPTALICASDAGAGGVLRWCAENRVDVPRELSVVGFDDDYSSRYLNPPLTTVAHPRANIARCAIEILAGHDHAHVLLPPTLVVRCSTAVPQSSKLGVLR